VSIAFDDNRDDRTERRVTARAMIRAGALATMFGVVGSGPVALFVVERTHPQPEWVDGATFAHAYHPIQILPYLLGFALVSGLLLLLTGIHAAAEEPMRPRATLALVFGGVFASMVFLNYVVQTTFVPALVRDVANARMIAAFSMRNPASLGWGLEMWGYGLLGVATWLVAPVFGRARIDRAASTAFVANGAMSVAGALWTTLDPGWVLTLPGLIAFAAWNVVLFVMAALALAAFRRPSHADAPC
jgi:hypothetical protein